MFILECAKMLLAVTNAPQTCTCLLTLATYLPSSYLTYYMINLRNAAEVSEMLQGMMGWNIYFSILSGNPAFRCLQATYLLAPCFILKQLPPF